MDDFTPKSGLPPAVRLSAAVYRRFSSSDGTDQHNLTIWLESHTLFVVAEGQGAMLVNGSFHLAASGKCLVLPPETAIEMKSEPSAPIGLFRLDFQVERDQTGLFERCSEVIFEPFSRLNDMLQSLLRELQEDGGGDGLARNAELAAFASHIRFQQLIYEVLNRPPLVVNELDARQAVERTIVYMQRAYREDISVGSLAKEANMSRYQYGAMFKSLTGQTAMDYLTDLRMERAKQLILESSSRVRDIAGRVGFHDEYYFSRRFKQTTGMTPTQYKLHYGRPPRVFTIQYLGEMLALGIRPIGTNRIMLDLFPEASNGVRGIDEPIDAGELLELKPELILFPSFAPSALIDKLHKIAPAVEVNWRDDVYARLRSMGDLLGRQKEAGDWISRYEAKAVRTRARLRHCLQQGETASAFVYHAGRLYVYAAHHFGHTLYRGIGFEAPVKIRQLIAKDPCLKWKPIPIEALPEYAGDCVFLLLPADGADAIEGRSIVRHPVWRDLPAVRSGRSHVVDDLWGNYNPLTLDNHLDEMIKWLERPHTRVGE